MRKDAGYRYAPTKPMLGHLFVSLYGDNIVFLSREWGKRLIVDKLEQNLCNILCLRVYTADIYWE